MTNVNPQLEKNIEEFRKRRNRQWLATIPFIVLMIAAFWFSDHPGQAPLGMPANVFLAVLALALTAMIFFSYRNWRCPACDGYLGKAMNPKFCPKCGAQLA